MLNPETGEMTVGPILPTVTSSQSKGCGEGACSGNCAKKPAVDPLLPPEMHVLSTLEADGSRRWLSPVLAKGYWWRRRRIVAYALIVIFIAIPHVRIGGEPLLLLNIAAREFIVFGHTFLPTDTLLLALLLVGIFLTVFLGTALAGRVWCGWLCPQTVYMEYLFRPLDRLFQGTAGRGGTPRKSSSLRSAARLVVYVLLSMLLAHTFLAYFVGTEQLARWLQGSPLKHPIAFLVMAGTTFAMLFDFLFFREQMCVIACPYGRFQSVLLDRSSLIVGYDPQRGEPRHKGKRKEGDNAGDCIDCGRCVAVCPTGIDIRDGLQMECINCTQCIDACDDVMGRVGLPPGLIRYSSQRGLEGKPQSLIRPRTIVYPVLLSVVAIAFVLVLNTKYGFDARLLRGLGAPFSRTADGEIVNPMRLRLVNRTDQPQTYSVEFTEPADVEVTAVNPADLELEPGDSVLVPLLVQFPASVTAGRGSTEAALRIADESGNEKVVWCRLLGPR